MYEQINGNTTGIPHGLLEQMKALYEIKVSRGVFAAEEMIELMAQFTGIINREISVLIARDGMVLDVSVGHFNRVSMPELRTIRSKSRLSGLRCLHTHPNSSGMLSEVDLATLSQARFDSMCAIGVVNGRPIDLYAAYLTGEEQPEYEIIGPLDPARSLPGYLFKKILEADKNFGRFEAFAPSEEQEKAVLIGLEHGGMEELEELAKTAGALVVHREVQLRPAPDKAFFLGSGKAQEMAMLKGDLGADIFIFDGELSAIQQRNLEELLHAKVVDRTTLILDIFAMRARSREGKLQVELAQLKYMLPRLMGSGIAMSRLGAGIGTRGPGESKLESDRRTIRRRIFELTKDIEEIKKQRDVRRQKREQAELCSLALVGYTNAGKSTLLNALTGADAFAEDKLFATLDPLARKAVIAGHEVVITDTVGFVRKLPHALVEAFRSTLEEAVHADILLHVVDASHPERAAQVEVVDQVLCDLGAQDTPRILVYNKLDRTHDFVPHDAVGISATTGQGMEQLHEAIARSIEAMWVEVVATVPYARGDVLHALNRHAQILEQQYETLGTRVRMRIPRAVLQRMENDLIIE